LNDYQTNGKKTYDHAERRIDLHLKPVFTGRRLLSISTAHIRAYAATRKTAGAANATINRELALLERMFSLAVKDGKLHGRPYVPMLQEDNTRKGFFEPAQFESVRAHLPEALRPVVTFAYLTGWRMKSEILPLEWRQVDWQGRVVRLDPGTIKNREGRTYPFTAALEKLLKEQLAEHERLTRRRIGLWRLNSTATVSESRTCGRPGTLLVRLPAARDAFRMTSAAPRFATSSAPGFRGQPRWPWLATRPKPSIVATRLSIPVCCVRLRRRLTWLSINRVLRWR